MLSIMRISIFGFTKCSVCFHLSGDEKYKEFASAKWKINSVYDNSYCWWKAFCSKSIGSNDETINSSQTHQFQQWKIANELTKSATIKTEKNEYSKWIVFLRMVFAVERFVWFLFSYFFSFCHKLLVLIVLFKVVFSATAAAVAEA